MVMCGYEVVCHEKLHTCGSLCDDCGFMVFTCVGIVKKIVYRPCVALTKEYYCHTW